jgi:hypothetical protein
MRPLCISGIHKSGGIFCYNHCHYTCTFCSAHFVISHTRATFPSNVLLFIRDIHAFCGRREMEYAKCAKSRYRYKKTKFTGKFKNTKTDEQTNLLFPFRYFGLNVHPILMYFIVLCIHDKGEPIYGIII